MQKNTLAPLYNFLKSYQDPPLAEASFNPHLSGEAHDLETVLASAEKFLSLSVNTHSSHFFNQLYAGPHPLGVLGDLLASLNNSTMATQEMSPLASQMEKALITKIAQMIGWTTTDGIMTAGGSQANLLAFLCAQQCQNPQFKTEGRQKNNLKIFISESAHYSFEKAAITVGLGTGSLIKIAVNHAGQMDTALLKKEIENSYARGETPLMIVATSGTTVRGAFDPLDDIAKVAHSFDLWFHIDACYGGGLFFVKDKYPWFVGMEKAQSMSWDAHKLLGMPLTCSFFLTSHPNILTQTLDCEGGRDYLFHEDHGKEEDLGRKSLACARRMDSLKLWLTWMHLGDKGFQKLIDQKLSLAKYAEEKILTTPELELVYPLASLNLCFRYKKNQTATFLLNVRQKLKEEHGIFLNYAQDKQGLFFRLVLINPKTTPKDIDHLLQKILSYLSF
ncbi:MAG: aminotransferase class V-fold PLP-dependent enzyme [Bacteriovoracaceae bacterium]|nr:aminotransferase class V-fold PLP-dependent enzyme [Bacteriovoracaceae bacterium]